MRIAVYMLVSVIYCTFLKSLMPSPHNNDYNRAACQTEANVVVSAVLAATTPRYAFADSGVSPVSVTATEA